jgi:hypothetical protein
MGRCRVWKQSSFVEMKLDMLANNMIWEWFGLCLLDQCTLFLRQAHGCPQCRAPQSQP